MTGSRRFCLGIWLERLWGMTMKVSVFASWLVCAVHVFAGEGAFMNEKFTEVANGRLPDGWKSSGESWVVQDKVSGWR